MIRILIVDDHKLMRDGCRTVLEREKDMEVVGEARDGIEAVELAQHLAPDIVLMDMSMPRLDGLGTLKRIQEFQPDVRVLVVSMTTDEAVVKTAMAKGASGYISKYSGFDILVSATRAVHAGKGYFSADVAEALSAEQGVA